MIIIIIVMNIIFTMLNVDRREKTNGVLTSLENISLVRVVSPLQFLK